MNERKGYAQEEKLQNSYISTCVPTYEKGINYTKRMKSQMTLDSKERSLHHNDLGENICAIREINLENTLIHRHNLETNLINRDLQFKNFQPIDFLCSVESHVPEETISSNNYLEIKHLANHFTGGITSFFGFESRLKNQEARSDYMFAISSKRGEREALANLFKKGDISEKFLKQPEWQQVGKFAEAWANPNSPIYERIKSLWFEFDTANDATEVPIPSIFLHTIPFRIDSSKDVKNIEWITRIALPLLTGQSVSKKIKENLLHCIQQIPKGASVLDIGVMLSRGTSGVRLVINRLSPNQIVPYLTSIGWSNEGDEELARLIKDLGQYINRIVLSIGVGEYIDPKVGIECRFSPDQYHLEPKWADFLNFLEKKGLCIPEKKSALLRFPGVEQDTALHNFDFDSFTPIAKLTNKTISGALVRYISHVKISYKPNQPLDVKAYLGIRLFGYPNESTTNNHV